MGMFEMSVNVDDWGNMWYNRGKCRLARKSKYDGGIE